MNAKTENTATKVAGASSSKAQEGEQDAPTTLVPKLRFPEFREAEGWHFNSLDSVAKISTEKVGDNTCIPMSITSGVGLVSQMEKFGRIIAGSSYANYLLLKKNDFAYNKSATKEYPEGFITLYSGHELAAVPNSIFTCFRIKGESLVPQYLNYLFLGNLHGKWLRRFIEVGARAHGSLSINDGDFLALPVPLPNGKTSLAEQQKIAECLSSVDELMAAQARKVDALKTHKKGLMQKLFPSEKVSGSEKLEVKSEKGDQNESFSLPNSHFSPRLPRLRFPEFQTAGEWEAKTLVEACRMQAGKFVAAADIKEQESGDLFPCYGGNGLRGFTETHTHDGVYPLIGRQGALCGNVKLATGKFHATEHAVVATPKRGVEAVWLYYLLDLLNLNRFATGQAQPGLSVDVLEKVLVSIPSDESEQQRIATCLSSLDALITAETQKLEALKTHKKGLMQQLFPSTEEVAG